MIPPASTIHFGELLLRLDAPIPERLVSARSLRASFTGGEVNVAATLARWGVPSAIVSKVPSHTIGSACLDDVRRHGVDVSAVRRGGERLGVLFVETGVPPRAGSVVYDRLHSSFRDIAPGEFDWDALLQDATWFHFTGTAPAAGAGVRAELTRALEVARSYNVPTSFDCGYRRALWSVEDAGEAFRDLAGRVDVLIGSERDAATFFGIESTGKEALADLQAKFGLRCVAFTSRERRLDGRQRYAAIVRDGTETHSSREHDFAVVDRIGAGDAFAAGLIRGLRDGVPLPETVEFATAAAVLTHTVPGDIAYLEVDEVAELAKGSAAALRR